MPFEISIAFFIIRNAPYEVPCSVNRDDYWTDIVVIWQHQEWKARGGIEMGFKIGFSAGVDNDYDDYKVQPELKQPAAPRKSLVEVLSIPREIAHLNRSN